MDAARAAGDEEARTTYLLIDGENLDATLGISVLGRRPNPDERPRWQRVLEFATSAWSNPVRGLFFINASSGNPPLPFVQALTAMGYRPLLLSGPPDVKVVDVGIQRTLDAIGGLDADVLLGSHDGDFLEHLQRLLDGTRRVGLLAFREFVNGGYAPLVADGLEVFDLEDDARSFDFVLPRNRIIDIDDFDPRDFL